MGFLFKLSLLIFILAIITFGFSYYLKNYSTSLSKNDNLYNNSQYSQENIYQKNNYQESNLKEQKNFSNQSVFFNQNEIKVLTPVEEKRDSKIENKISQELEESTTAAKEEIEITIEAKEFKFEPNIFKVKENQEVKLIVKNTGNIPHNLKIEKENIVYQTSLIAPGEEAILEFKAPVKGEYDFYCSLSDHKMRGMFGKMIVE